MQERSGAHFDGFVATVVIKAENGTGAEKIA